MRTKHVILVRPCYDRITAHTHRWSEKLRQTFESNG
uniref:Uncharacterized protein n=1 Tax=Candidatus Kentrum sp. MB TaxID=2138164 RepID=A0A451BBI6_9GAMM|nr:MAG: hypothetical protein BECKMB1821G_GA0114241_101430 [Candidatus Kentron sp. MB]VFK31729.1 MAG: hypothetical protein BECKMB1821I_GA0114274_102632 [Candidatus Kentron sp. MB]VFK75632.1 MAG: hypothetical protein BECKMB1821H_GA0114242_102731 [Candidatus Kentron sp. MB]